jgi:sulfide:quinone oxidoreductase
VRLATGEELPYDALLVAVGARRRDWLEGALHFGGAADVTAFRALLQRLVSGSDQRLCFVNPPSPGWTLPLYELALLTASHLADAGVIGAELTVATPETDPLSAFGPAAGGMLRNLLADRGIALRTAAQATRIDHGKLHFESGATLEVEQIVAIAELEGREFAGLPCDANGFIPVDEHSRVTGLRDVYAAGDGTTFPIKQGGIATQQADVAAEAIAAQLGDAIVPSPLRPMLRGMLLTGIAPTYMRAQLGATAESSSFEAAASPLWWPPGKIAGRYLAPYLAGHNPLTRDQTLADLAPPPQDPGRAEGLHEEARELALTLAERDATDGHFESALQWLEVIERLDGVLPPGYLQKRDIWRRHL